MTKTVKLKVNGWEPDIMTPEEAVAYMDANGIRYEICDTPVPVLSNKVSCGLPADMGDIMIEEFTSLPKSAVRQHFVIDVPARGDSMIEADIHDDDWLQLEVGAIPSDGDIVMADVDGEFLAKVYFTDNQNRKWLLPKNKNYKPIQLTPKDQPRISGVVHHVTRKAPRQSYNECMAILNSALLEMRQEGDAMQRLAKAVGEGNLLFWAASAWAVAYCVARDCCGYEESVSDFERKAAKMDLPKNFAFPCSVGKVQRTISNHPYMRLHIDKWKENGASIREIILMEFLRRSI